MDTVPELNRLVRGLFLDRQDFQHLLNHITQLLPVPPTHRAGLHT